MTPKAEDGPRLARAMEASELDRRITVLEEPTRKLENTLLERHARLITIIFSCITAFVAVCAILVTALGWLSKSDARDATREMENRVDKATAEIERKFQTLAGEALKRPAIQILTDSGPLEGRTITLARVPYEAFDRTLANLFLKNVGDRRTEPISIRISCAAPLPTSPSARQDWEQSPTSEPEYKTSLVSTRHSTTVADGETLNIHPLTLSLQATPYTAITAPCKIQVFYGAERPAEARFQITLGP